jgi:hypothetical protein
MTTQGCGAPSRVGGSWLVTGMVPHADVRPLPHIQRLKLMLYRRHCEERSDEASPSFAPLDCFAEPVIGRRFAPTRWLAMTWK